MRRKIDLKLFKGFIDTTLREGQQSPLLFDSRKYNFDIEDKKTIVKGLVGLGIRYFEFFSPIVSPLVKDDLFILKEYVKGLTKEKLFFLSHCRVHPTDIEASIKAGFDGLNLYLSFSKLAQKHNYNKTFSDLRKRAISTIKDLKENYPKIYIRFSAEDTFRTSLSNIYRIYDEISEYVNTFGIPDTTGMATPKRVREIVRKIKKRYPNNYLEGHFHNDRGFSLVNALTAIESGIDFVDTSIWGLGERSGITSVTGILFNLFHSDKRIVKRYNIALSYPLNIQMGSILNLQVPYNEPVSLTNRTHIAGVHQKAVLNNSIAYEGSSLERFGVNRKQVLLGPLSGWHSIYYYLNEILDYEVSKKDALIIRDLFKGKIEKEDIKKTPVEILKEIAVEMRLKKREIPFEESERRLEIIE